MPNTLFICFQSNLCNTTVQFSSSPLTVDYLRVQTGSLILRQITSGKMRLTLVFTSSFVSASSFFALFETI